MRTGAAHLRAALQQNPLQQQLPDQRFLRAGFAEDFDAARFFDAAALRAARASFTATV
jgi:hypothetical protein